MTPPRLEEASRRPSGLKATLVTPLVWPVRVCRGWPVATSQTVIIPSPLPEASRRPSGRKATAETPLVATGRLRTCWPLVALQIRRIQSLLAAEANHLPSGLYARPAESPLREL